VDTLAEEMEFTMEKIREKFAACFLALLCFAASGCGSSNCDLVCGSGTHEEDGKCVPDYDPSGDADPRCLDLCRAEMPDIDGAGQYCSQGSVDNCLLVCQARIDGLETLCQTCLLEGAEFGLYYTYCSYSECCSPQTGGGEICGLTSGGWCEPDMSESQFQDCVCTRNDDACYDACRRQLCPREAVDCNAPYFDDVSECMDICGG
jgi:hypothetical protein